MKRVKLIVVSLMLVLGLAACERPAVEIRWFLGMGSGGIVDAWVDDFNAAHPKIVLTVETVSTETAHDVLLAEIAAGNPPDIVGPLDGCTAASTYADLWLDLDPYLASYDLSNFRQDALEYLRRPGRGLMGLPTVMFPSVLFINRDLFDQAGLAYPPVEYGQPYAGRPWDWGKLAEIARLLTLDRNGSDANAPGFDPSQIAQLGFRLQQEDGCIHATTYLNSEDLLAAQTDIPFNSGRVAMAYAYSTYLNEADDLANWDFAVPPAETAGGHQVAAVLVYMAGVLKLSRHPAEAVQVIYAILDPFSLVSLIGAVPAQLELPSWTFDYHEEYPTVHVDAMLTGLEHALDPRQCCSAAP